MMEFMGTVISMVLVTFISTAIAAPLPYSSPPPQSSSTTQSLPCPHPIDALFLIDASTGMDLYLSTLSTRVSHFTSSMMRKGYTDIRIGVVAFGGRPTVIQPFSSNLTSFYTTFTRLASSTGATYGWSSQTAGLEALRVVLSSTSTVSVDALDSNCTRYSGDTISLPCQLTWRPDAVKSIVMVTDGDSALPVSAGNRQSGQETGFPSQPIPVADESQYPELLTSPPFSPSTLWYNPSLGGYQRIRSNVTALTIPSSWQAEINATAQAIITSGASISIFSKSDFNGNTQTPISSWNDINAYRLNMSSGVSIGNNRDDTIITHMQYGNAQLNVHTTVVDPVTGAVTYTQFDADATRVALLTNRLALSLQAQVLGSGLDFKIYPLQFINDFDQNALGLMDAGLAGPFLQLGTCTVVSTTTTTTVVGMTSTISTDTTAPTSTPTTNANGTTTGEFESNNGSDNSSAKIGAIAGGIIGSFGLAVAGLAIYRGAVTARVRMTQNASPISGNNMNPIYEKPIVVENPIYVPATPAGVPDTTPAIQMDSIEHANNDDGNGIDLSVSPKLA